MFDQWLILVISDKVVGKKTQIHHIRPSSQPKLLHSPLIKFVEFMTHPTSSNMDYCKLLPAIFRSDSSCNGKVKRYQLMAVRLVCCINHNALRKMSELLFCMIASKKRRWFFFLYQFWLVLDDCDQEPPDEPPKGFEQHILLKRKCGECIAFYQSYTVLPPFIFSIFTPVSTLQNQELILAAFSSNNGTIESFPNFESSREYPQSSYTSCLRKRSCLTLLTYREEIHWNRLLFLIIRRKLI